MAEPSVGRKWELCMTTRLIIFPPKRLPDGQWMMSRRDHKRAVTVMVGGVKAFDQWSNRALATYDGTNRQPEETVLVYLEGRKDARGTLSRQQWLQATAESLLHG